MNVWRWLFFFVVLGVLLIGMPLSAHQRVRTIEPVALGTSGIVDADDLWFSTFIGGYDFDKATDVAVGADGSVYVTGYAGQAFPTTPGAYQTTFGGDWCDAFIAKLHPDGKSVVYATYIGGSGADLASGISVGSNGAAYVVGSTDSVNFPTTAGVLQPSDQSGADAFVVKLSPDGSTLEYATYLGGSGWDSAADIVVDDDGNAYVVGTSRSSPDFPTTAGAYDPSTNGVEDVFVIKLNANGSALHYGTFLGGGRWDWGWGISADDTGAAYVTGDTYGDGFPLTSGAFQTQTSGIHEDAFVTKLLPDGSDLVYSTLLTGYSDEYDLVRSSGKGIAVNPQGIAYVVGQNSADDFPTTPGAFQTMPLTGYDVFVTLLNADGSDVVYSTLMGGSGSDVGLDIAVDTGERVYLTGRSGSMNLPTTPGAIQRSLRSWTPSYNDAFFAVLLPEGNGWQDLLYATYLGGAEDDAGEGVVLHPQGGTAYVAGFTTSEDFPVTVGAYDTTYGGGQYGNEPYGDGFVAQIQPGLPRIVSVTPCVPGPYYYWPGWVPWENTYTAQIAWRDYTPDHVDFVLNGVTNSVNVSSSFAQITYDLRTDLLYSATGQRNTLEIRAVSNEGLASPVYSVEFWGLEPPTWFPIKRAAISSPACGIPMTAWWAFDFPDPAFVAEISADDIPADFPYIGGNDFGIQATQATMTVTLSGDGQSGGLALSGMTGFQVGDVSIAGQISGSGTGSISPEDGTQIDAATFGLNLDGSVSAEKPLVEVVCQSFAGACPLTAAESWSGIGGTIKQFNEVAVLEATISPSLDLGFDFAHDGTGLQWQQGTGTGELTVSAAIVMDLVEDVLVVEAGTIGSVAVTLQTPPDPSYLKGVHAQLGANVSAKYDDFVCQFDSDPYEWTYPGTGTTTTGVVEPESPTFDILYYCALNTDQAYQSSATGYSVFSSAINQRAGMASLVTEENVLVYNVYPDTHPALAADDDLLLVWVHDDPAKPVWESKDLVYSTNDGLGWSTPATITQDVYQDYSPQIAYADSGKAVAVWKRHREVLSSATQLDADYLNGYEIAHSVLNGGVWTAPVYLTDNAVLDHAPVLAPGNDGKLLLLWRQNGNGELLGSAAAPDTVMWSVWDGTDWSVPNTLLSSVVGLVDLGAARYGPNTMIVAYSQDVDGDLTTKDDQEIFTLSWDGASWGAAAQLTDDAIADHRPKVLYDGAGAVSLLWLKEDSLHAHMGSLAGTPQAVVVAGDPALLDYALARDNAGNLALLWQGLSEQGIDVFYAAYDQTNGVFSLVDQMTFDAALEKFMSPVFASTGGLVMAYSKTSLSQQAMIRQTSGQTDLVILEHSFGTDLTVSDLLVTPVNPDPGSTAVVSITLHNDGDRAVLDPQVALYRGDPDAGGALVDSVTTPITMVGGMEIVVGADWAVPASGGPYTLYAVADPGDVVSELDEDNNVLSALAAAPDLLPASMQVAYGTGQVVTITVPVDNVGGIEAPANAIAFVRDDPVTGTLVVSETLASLAAGVQTDVVVAVDVTSWDDGNTPLYAIVDPGGEVIEVDEGNNTVMAEVAVLPDLVLQASQLTTEVRLDGKLLVNALIHNTGLRDAVDVPVGIYEVVPEVGVMPVMSTTATIPAFGHGYVGFALSSLYRSGFYIGAGWDGVFEDRYFGDNRLLRGQPLAKRVYLPVALRGH